MEKCGLVRLSDLQDSRRASAFREMERFSAPFLRDRERWWPDVPWPPDALHQWSRQYEYPWILHHLAELGETSGRILDAGSGITFFPFYLKSRGLRVRCFDGDERLGAAFVARNELLPARLRVSLEIGDLGRLPYRSASYSTVICVSVLEHLPLKAAEAALAEFHRVLSPKGICLITVDVSLEAAGGESFLNPGNLEAFRSTLIRSGLEPLFDSDSTNHSPDLLSTDAFRSQPDHLPWNHSTARTMAGALKHWTKTAVLRRRTFHSIGLAVFACRRAARRDGSL